MAKVISLETVKWENWYQKEFHTVFIFDVGTYSHVFCGGTWIVKLNKS